jgi:hypothetical protein
MVFFVTFNNISVVVESGVKHHTPSPRLSNVIPEESTSTHFFYAWNVLGYIKNILKIVSLNYYLNMKLRHADRRTSPTTTKGDNKVFVFDIWSSPNMRQVQPETLPKNSNFSSCLQNIKLKNNTT